MWRGASRRCGERPRARVPPPREPAGWAPCRGGSRRYHLRIAGCRRGRAIQRSVPNAPFCWGERPANFRSRRNRHEPIPIGRTGTRRVPTVEEPMAENELLTPGEVAIMFRVNPKTVTRWARAGKISAVRTLGGHRRFRASEIRRFLEEAQDLQA